NAPAPAAHQGPAPSPTPEATAQPKVTAPAADEGKVALPARGTQPGAGGQPSAAQRAAESPTPNADPSDPSTAGKMTTGRGVEVAETKEKIKNWTAKQRDEVRENLLKQIKYKEAEFAAEFAEQEAARIRSDQARREFNRAKFWRTKTPTELAEMEGRADELQ